MLRTDGAQLHIQGEAVPAGVLWVAVTEAGLETTATRGENRGRRLLHAPVVRSFRELGRNPAGAVQKELGLEVDRAWTRAKLQVVAAVQDPVSGTILALGSTALEN